jgi:hypothetical protein
MKRASHVGCNACNGRIQRVLHRICYSNVAHWHMKRVLHRICYSNVAHWHMKRVLHRICYSNVAHMKRAYPYNIRVTFAQNSH